MANSPLHIDLLNAVMDMVSEATGVIVIPGNDNHPAPNSLYATVLDISIIGEGIDATTARNASDPEEVDLSLKGSRIGNFSIQFYRAGAADAIENLLSFNASAAGQLWLCSNGFTWKKSSEVRNLDGIAGSKWEERRSVDVELKYMSTRVDTVKSLVSAEIIIEMTDSIDITETEEVTE